MIPVKIKPDKYGNAIGLLIRLGGGFQTRYQNMLIVTGEQLRILEAAGFVDAGPAEEKASKPRGKTKA
jgi:hypothetical protein